MKGKGILTQRWRGAEAERRQNSIGLKSKKEFAFLCVLSVSASLR
jgi:hypothetical protein